MIIVILFKQRWNSRFCWLQLIKDYCSEHFKNVPSQYKLINSTRVRDNCLELHTLVKHDARLPVMILC